MITHRFGGALLVVVLLSTLLVGTASADRRRSTMLSLTVTTQTASTTVRLRCYPTGGTHPSPGLACRDLAAAHGDFDNLPGTPGTMCTMLYQPVVAAARGTWLGSPVRWRHRFGNACTMHAETGVVFDF
jgi:hypothetical protein